MRGDDITGDFEGGTAAAAMTKSRLPESVVGAEERWPNALAGGEIGGDAGGEIYPPMPLIDIVYIYYKNRFTKCHVIIYLFQKNRVQYSLSSLVAGGATWFAPG